MCTLYFVDIGTYDGEGPPPVQVEKDMEEPQFPTLPRPILQCMLVAKFQEDVANRLSVLLSLRGSPTFLSNLVDL